MWTSFIFTHVTINFHFFTIFYILGPYNWFVITNKLRNKHLKIKTFFTQEGVKKCVRYWKWWPSINSNKVQIVVLSMTIILLFLAFAALQRITLLNGIHSVLKILLVTPQWASKWSFLTLIGLYEFKRRIGSESPYISPLTAI